MDELRQDLNKEEKFITGTLIAYLLLIIFLLVAIRSFIQGHFLNISISIAGIIFVLVLKWLSRKLNKFFIDIFISMINVFLFISMYLGSIKGFYGLFPWWDVIAHALSGIILSLLGFILVFVFDKDIDLHDRGKFFLTIVFSMALGIAGGAIWEIYEFSMGVFFNLNMQSGGLLDTMKDIISDTVGAIFASVSFGIYIKVKLADVREEGYDKAKSESMDY